jgi:MFS family permease
MATLIAVTIASIADITSEAERGKCISAIMGSLYFGGMVGPVLSGHVTHYFGMSVTFWLCLLLNVLQILLVSAFFEESASPIDVTKQEEAVDVSFYELTIGPVVWLFSASSVLRRVFGHLIISAHRHQAPQ